MIKKTELYIEEKQIDLFGDEAFLLNFNVADISDISAKAASYSKEVDIPATKENNKTFSHLFNVSSEGHFNPISKKTSEVYVDGVCVMKGFFKLNGITVIDNEYVTYHGVIYEDSVNFVQALGDLELSNLVLPLTGTTAVPATGTTASIVIDQITGTDYRFLPPSPGTLAARRYNANYNNLVTTGAIYGSLQAIDKNVPNNPWTGTLSQQSTTTINAFVALQKCRVKLTPAITISPSRTLGWAWYKITPNGSTYLHTQIAGANGGGPFLSSSITTPTPAAGVDLEAGEGIYLLIADYTVVSNTTSLAPAPPIGISTSSQITGTVQPLLSSPVNNLLIDENFILTNINAAVNSDTTDICFPLIDYNQTFPYSATNKKNSQLTEYEKPGVRVKFEDLRPAIFVKRVWDAIFQQAGFKYKSKFLDTNADLFKKLIVIGGMEEDEVQSLQYDNVLTGSTQYLLEEPVQDVETNPGLTSYVYDYKAFLLGGKVPNASPTNYWNKKLKRASYTENLLSKYTDANRNNAAHGFSGAEYGDVLKALVAGRYKIQAQIKGTSLPVLYGTNNAPLNKQGIIYRLKIETIKGGSYNNDPVLFQAPAKSKWEEEKVVTFKRLENTSNQDFILTFDETIELEQGDMARVVLYASAEAQWDPNSTDSTAYKSRTNLLVDGTCYVKYYRLGSWVGYEATSLTNMLPRSMKQSEFVLSISKMFNLYFEPDKQDPRTIYVEPRDTYYEDGRVLNWEKKLDYSKPIDITILPHDQAKNFVFKYEDDSNDYYTEQFKKFTPNGLTFGSYQFVSNDEYVTETTDLVPIFAASYLQKISGTDPSSNYTGTDANPMVITKIIDPDSQKPGYEGKPSDWKKDPRILIYGGKINLPPIDYRNYRFFLTGNEPDGDEYEIDFPYYPYAGHYDTPVQPTVDINFFTDTQYLRTTYWQNSFGIANNPATPTFSTTTVDLSTVSVGQNVAITYTGTNYFTVNANVNKYVRLYSQTTPNTYFDALIVSATSATLTLKITNIYGTASVNYWKITLIDVQMKYNLFNVFYKNQMIELTDQSARLMSCSMYLTPVDIANFRFNDIVYAHGEYWRVNKIIDFDTSSDVNQTTKIELIKILRADTNKLIDYIVGGYLGIQGGTGGGTTTTGTGTGVGTTPGVVQLGPAGTQSQYTQDTPSQLNVYRNSIIQDAEGLVPTFFNKEVTIYTGTQDLQDTVVKISNDLNFVREIADTKPIGESITYTDADAGNQTLDGRYGQVYFDVTARNILFIITLQDVAAVDGFTVHFDALNDTTTTFMQIENGNATTNEIFVINQDNSVVAKYDAAKEKWIISKA